MAVNRLRFISVTELNEILNESFADDATTQLMIAEACEKIDHELMGRVESAIEEWTALSLYPDFTAVPPLTPTEALVQRNLDNLKLAAAYQVQFIDNGYYDNEINDDCACKTCLSPKAHTYLIKTSLWSRWL